MTLSLPRTRLLTVAAALGYTAFTFGALTAPVEARDAAYYKVQLAEPTAQEKVIVRGTAFVCRDDKCIAAKGRSRAEVMCGRLRKEVGPIVSFSADGTAFTAEQIAACNAD
ncbi:hypothetical protein [Qipengyuania sp. JC766]|uniref:CC_3452 family protein n=1 Tax=Qipengyuania sp. JC766 TaxID=3232139 RepID=UPI003457E0DC